MAFFNLTELGATDPVKSSIDKNLKDETKSASTCHNSQAEGSHVKYTRMLQKHQRSPKGKLVHNEILN